MPDAIALLLLSATLSVAALVQGTIGFGAALVAAPVFLLIDPSLVPGTLLLLGIPLNLWVAVRDRAGVDARAVRALLAGLLVGTVAGYAVLDVASGPWVSFAIGAGIVLAAIVSTARTPREAGPRARLAAGAASGLVNTLAATGGPPLALLYRGREPLELRGTLAVAFLVSQVLSLAAVLAAGRLSERAVLVSVALLPALVLGAALSGVLAGHLRAGALRTAVVAFSILAGTAAMARALI